VAPRMRSSRRYKTPLGAAEKVMWVWINTYRYIFSGMNIHLPAILGFTTRVLTHPHIRICNSAHSQAKENFPRSKSVVLSKVMPQL
jgi:hypothetical protein